VYIGFIVFVVFIGFQQLLGWDVLLKLRVLNIEHGILNVEVADSQKQTLIFKILYSIFDIVL